MSRSGQWSGASDADPFADLGETLADDAADPADAENPSGESGPSADHSSGGSSDDESDRDSAELG